MTNFKEDLSRIKAFIFDVDGVISGSTLTLSREGDPARTANIKDGFAMQLAIKNGYKIAIISGAKTEYLRVRFKGLGVQDVYLGAADKRIAYQDFLNKYQLKNEDILYMGDDIPDIPVMKMVGTPTCPADAADEVKDISKYISNSNGGCGCVRDVIEQVLKAQNNWIKSDSSFHW